jgi:hypothetical protein
MIFPLVLTLLPRYHRLNSNWQTRTDVGYVSKAYIEIRSMTARLALLAATILATIQGLT